MDPAAIAVRAAARLRANSKKTGALTPGVSALADTIRQSVLDGDQLHKIIVLLCHAGGEPVRGRTKMQKLVFMLSQIYGRDEEMGFEPDMYGPYSEIVEEERSYLEGLGILSSRGNRIGITAAGIKVAEALAEQEPEMLKVVARYKTMFNDMTTNEVLAYVYAMYPDMAKKSLVSKKIKSRMDMYVMSMLRKRKITSGRASMLLGKSRESIIKKCARDGMPVLEADDP